MNEICGLWLHAGWKRTSETDITQGFFEMMRCGQPRNLTGVNRRICLQSNWPLFEPWKKLLTALQSKKTPRVKDLCSFRTERNAKNILFSYYVSVLGSSFNYFASALCSWTFLASRELNWSMQWRKLLTLPCRKPIHGFPDKKCLRAICCGFRLSLCSP